VEVFGNVGLPSSVGRVTHFACGRNVTVAVVGPSTKPEDVHGAYKRAVQADTYNADILRQYEVSQDRGKEERWRDGEMERQRAGEVEGGMEPIC
jgi:hypothetical protein